MNATAPPPIDLSTLKVDEFDVRTLDDEIRVDGLCTALLRRFFKDLTETEDFEPLEAGELCLGADYFLKEFLIADRHFNPFHAGPDQVRQFAGHWYIIRTPEPNMTELAGVLAGVHACYHYLSEQQLIAAETAKAIIDACADLPYYQQRIEDFWAIEDDGYFAWRNACPLPPVPDN